MYNDGIRCLIITLINRNRLVGCRHEWVITEPIKILGPHTCWTFETITLIITNKTSQFVFYFFKRFQSNICNDVLTF